MLRREAAAAADDGDAVLDPFGGETAEVVGGDDFFELPVGHFEIAAIGVGEEGADVGFLQDLDGVADDV